MRAIAEEDSAVRQGTHCLVHLKAEHVVGLSCRAATCRGVWWLLQRDDESATTAASTN